jgi:hypothetical protein
LGRKLLREDSLAVGRSTEEKKGRTLAAVEKRLDLRSICLDFGKMKPADYMDMVVNYV